MMTIENYNQTIQLRRSADQIFKTLTDEIPLRWTALFEKASNSKNELIQRCHPFDFVEQGSFLTISTKL